MHRFKYVLGIIEGDTFGSNSRRLFSRLSVLLMVYILYELFANSQGEALITAGIGLFLSLIFFVVTVTWVIYFSSSKEKPEPLRLIADILVSGAFAIISFALMYREIGIVDTLFQSVIPNSVDMLYFSAVTFSTLGFGDFRPVESARLFSAAQAILGNLHLGLLAGAVFYAMQQRISSELPDDDAKHESDESNTSNNIRRGLNPLEGFFRHNALLSCLNIAARRKKINSSKDVTQLSSPQNLTFALLILRLGGAFFLLTWASLKFIRPEWMVSVYNHTYGWDFVTKDFAYGVGVVQLIVALFFLIGFQRRWIYGFVVVIHATGVAAAIPRMMHYWTFPHNRYLTTVTALGAFVALFLLRDHDKWTLDHWLKKRKDT